MENVKILITPGDNNDGFNLHSAWERKFFQELDDAREYGKQYAENKARELAEENGVKNPEITVTVDDVYATSGDGEGDGDIYIETNIDALATDTPDRGMTMDD